jgi:ABC-type nitrate/sulfonate/bicarbonate transport system permease component
MAEMRAPVTRLPVPAPPVRPEYLRDVVAGRDIGVVQKPLTSGSGSPIRGGCERRSSSSSSRSPGSSTRAGSTTRCWCRPSRPRSRLLERHCQRRHPAEGVELGALLLKGYALGSCSRMSLTALAMMFQLGNDLLETLTSAFNPLPAIALLPLALIWFGLGDVSIIFVLVHSVLWAVALNTHSGFRSVSNTLRMVGRNYGLRGIPFVAKILIPAAFPSILTGLKIGWAFAWRTLIAAELVFGVSSGKGGLGWYIYENKNMLDIPAVFAGLFTVILIGLDVENLIFRNIEAATVRRGACRAEPSPARQDMMPSAAAADEAAGPTPRNCGDAADFRLVDTPRPSL